ncbi:MAG TPA: phosphatase PAP2 family protein [Verrucomicrobiae bacterium]
MKLFQRLLTIVFFSLAVAIAPLHAAKTNSVSTYLPAGKPDAIALLAPSPLPGSPEQAADMDEVRNVHSACTTNEAALAFSEKKFSVFNFAPVVGSFFQPDKLPKTEAFFKRVKTDASIITDSAKNHWQRPRPFVTDTNLASGELEKSFSYPSGHSTEATVLALVLADMIPDKKDAILAEGRAIGWHRVEIARHYSTDIYAGRVFAQAIVRELMASPDFQRDFAESKAEIALAQTAIAAAKN